MTKETIIDVSDLSVHFSSYEGRHRVLNGVDLTIGDGETVALVGETGCGKSVTAKTIMGTLRRPPAEVVEGTVSFRGQNLLDDPSLHTEIQSNHMSMIFQDPMSHLSPVFTIGEMMTDVLHYHREEGLSWRRLITGAFRRKKPVNNEAYREQCIEMLERLQIPDPAGVMHRYPDELSGGMRQRVLIAMALLNEPDFLVADEPTTALDVTVQEQILELLESRIVEEDLSMLYITHNLGVARKLADRIYVMYAGTIVETGETQEVFDDPLHPYSRGLIESIPKLTGFGSSGIPGGIPDYTQPPRGCRFYPRCPAYIEGTCDSEPPRGFEVDGREVHCYLYDDEPDLETAIEIAEDEVDYLEYGSTQGDRSFATGSEGSS